MTAKKWLLAALVAVAALAAIYTVLPNKDESEPASSETTQAENETQTDTESTDEQKTFTAAEVAAHDSKADCWTIIEGDVYDLTSFVNSHPGGDEILRACGEDGTTLFNERETEDGEEVGSGTPHSSSARSQLESLKIGSLAD